MLDELILGAISAQDIWQGFLNWLSGTVVALKVLIGFSLIIFVHELGHFLAARWMGVRVDRFAVGFFTRLCGWRRGEGFTFGPRPEYNAEQLALKGYGETDYCINALPFGGYVKMLGEDDIQIDEKTGQMIPSADPRAFTNKPVWRRMVVVSAGVIFNMVFAILVYALVFGTVGKQVRSPVLGYVEPGGTAARAGLMSGDRVLKIDGEPIAMFDDIIIGALLAGEKITFTIQRGDAPPHDVVVTLPASRENVREVLAVQPAARSRIPETASPATLPNGLRPGDEIIEVNGMPVASGSGIEAAWLTGASKEVDLSVRRDEKVSSLTMPKQLFVTPVEAGDEREVGRGRHILGFRPRQAARVVIEGEPAYRGGLREGDVLLRWGTVVNPTLGDVLDSISANDGKAVEVLVQRGAEELTLSITPQRPVSLIGSDRPRVGVEFGLDDRNTVVADIAPDTPAAAIGMPRGAAITEIDGKPVADWFEIVDALRRTAGSTVVVKYRSGAESLSGEMAVPRSIGDELGLPPLARVTRIDGNDRIEVSPGKTLTLPSPQAARAMLEKCVGRTVEIEYTPNYIDPAAKIETRPFAVTEANFDPWPLRITYLPPRLTLELLTEPLIERNPVKAVGLALTTTYGELYKVYRMLQSMLSMNVSLKHVSGPVGIFGVAYQEANAGIGDLLFFLAFLSVNLAVLNFLPLPVVDGGLMVFLILEKLRGKPVSVKVQVITTLTGLALIVLCFLFVTIQDITRLISS